MPSRAELRIRLEHAARVVVIASLVAMLWQWLRPPSGADDSLVRARGVGTALAKWSASPPGRIQLQLDSTPTPVQRAWLGALKGAGASITWSGDIAPLMLEARPIASPAGGTRLLVAARSGTAVVVSDDVGPIDTVHTQTTGASIDVNSVADRVSARARGTVASTMRPDSVLIRRVLVIGAAGWESKFVVAALEEDGWKVDPFIRVAPGIDITPGPLPSLDTARYSAVVALDSTAAPSAGRISEYVRNGGGLILGPTAAALDQMKALRAGGVTSASAATTVTATSLATLSLSPIAPIVNEAIALQRRASATSIAARRVGAGRVVQMGYQDTWRWRMAGGDESVRDHRKWWSGLVSGVAYAPALARKSTSRGEPDGMRSVIDEAPVANLVAAIGPQTLSTSGPISMRSPAHARLWLFVIMAVALIAEVASRRSRGEA